MSRRQLNILLTDETEQLLDRLTEEMAEQKTEVVRRALRHLAQTREQARRDAERAVLHAGRLRAALRGAGLDAGEAEVKITHRGRVIARLGEFSYFLDRESGELLRWRAGADYLDMALVGQDGSIEFAESFTLPKGAE